MLHVVEPIGLTGEPVIDAYLPRLNTDKLEREGLQRILEQMKKRLRKFCREDPVSGTGAVVYTRREM